MFPSPIGELHFSIKYFQPNERDAKVSVPYRGATFLNLNQEVVKRKNQRFPSPIGELHFSILSNGLHCLILNAVSVPYRGATFLNSSWLLKNGVEQGFRPLSGSYISQLEWVKYCGKVWIKFPSPIGELHFSIVYNDGRKVQDVFPSPIGELHFSIISQKWIMMAHSFRPLSGSYISQSKLHRYRFLTACFRPLSGSYISQLEESDILTFTR